MEKKKALVVVIFLSALLLCNHLELCSAQDYDEFRCRETCTMLHCDQLPDARSRDRCDIKCEIQCRP
ncbi:unnamed protein product, partial [Linum tenue]